MRFFTTFVFLVFLSTWSVVPSRAEGEVAKIHNALAAQGLPVVSVRKTGESISVELAPEATQQQQDAVSGFLLSYQPPNLPQFRADVESDSTIAASKRLKLLQLYDLLMAPVEIGDVAKVQGYWAALKAEEDWLDATTAGKVETHAAINHVPLVAE